MSASDAPSAAGSGAVDRWLDRPVVAIAVLTLILGVFRLEYLVAEAPWWDEFIPLQAAALYLDGESPYTQRDFNYPPSLVQVIATAERGGWTRELVVGWRLANLLAVAALAWFSAGRTGWSIRGRFLAALAVGFSPVIGQAIDFGNFSPMVAILALAALSAERRRPWLAALALGASVALKPVVLVGAAFLTAHRLLASPRRGLLGPSLLWPFVAGLLVAPGATLLPAMLQKMSHAYFDRHHLSIKRVLAGLGWEVPAAWIALVVLVVALLVTRRRPIAPERMVIVAPVVALAALPVVWAHTFALTLPLQMEAVARLRSRWSGPQRPSGRERGALDLWQAIAVLVGVAAPHAAAFASLVNDWPDPLQIVVCLIPASAPAILLHFLSRTAPESPLPGG